MKIFQCANNACSGGAPMVFPQSALSVQDILNMQEANLLGTLPSGLLPCNSSCYGCPLSASNSSQNASSLFPLTGSCCTNGSSGAESNSSAAQQSCSPGIFPLSNSADNCPPASAVQTQATIQNTSSADCTPCSSAMPLSVGIFPLMDSPTNCPPATTPAAPLGTVAAPPIVPAPLSRAAAPSLPVQNAAQFLVKTLASSNQPITAQPDVVRGEDISLEEEKIVFAPGALYLVSYQLDAKPQDGSFAEISAEINNELRPEFSSTQHFLSDQEQLYHAFLHHLFLLDTTQNDSPVALSLTLHTDSTAPVPLKGNLLAFRL